MAAVAIETEHWDTAVQTVADTVRQLPVEDGHPVVHWQTMTAAWLGLWAAAELARERGEAGSAWLAPHLAELDRLLAAAARRPLDRRTVRDHALLALCEAERTRLRAHSELRGLATSSRGTRHPRRRGAARLRPGTPGRDVAERERRPERGRGGAQRCRRPPRRRTPVADPCSGGAGRPPSATAPRRPPRTTRRSPTSHDRFGLTEREADVLRLLAEARTNREIGETLFISPKTVSVHVTSLMRKLGVRKRAEAARLAKRAVPER